MKGLRIDLKLIEPKTNSKWFDYILIALLLIVALILLPLLLLFWIFGIIFNFISQTKSIDVENNWQRLLTGTNQSIRFKYVTVDEMPEYIYKYFDTQPLIIFDSNPYLDFFSGYFTDFKVERDDGIFIQKVIQNDEIKAIQSLPLYFFSYLTQEVQEIKDLKGYEFDIKGNPNDFIINGIGEEGELEIRLRKE
ncbi:MAG: hypothetical protein R2776_06275 [Flavobacteriaceae bacterium]